MCSHLKNLRCSTARGLLSPWRGGQETFLSNHLGGVWENASHMTQYTNKQSEGRFLPVWTSCHSGPKQDGRRGERELCRKKQLLFGLNTDFTFELFNRHMDTSVSFYLLCHIQWFPSKWCFEFLGCYFFPQRQKPLSVATTTDWELDLALSNKSDQI